MNSDNTSEDNLPLLIVLLKQAQIIGPVEVEALMNQMSVHPDSPIVDLVIQSGYVTETDIKSLWSRRVTEDPPVRGEDCF